MRAVLADFHSLPARENGWMRTFSRTADSARSAVCLFVFLWPRFALAAPQAVAAELRPGEVAISVAGKLFTVYRFDPKLKKPYFWPVVGPASGLSVTVESMADHHPHHNSVWFGCDRLNGGNYWQPHGQLSNGHIRSEGAEIVQAGGEEVVFTDACVWRKPGEAPVVSDVRRVTVRAPSSSLRFIDFEITLRMLVDVTILKNNHSLFSVRMVPELSVDSGGTLVNAEGAKNEKGTFGKPSPWCDYYGTREGVTEGVAVFDHPRNRWYPCRWFTRDYGFMSPTPMYWPPDGKGHYFAQGEELRLRYRVVVHGGTTDDAAIPGLFASYAAVAARERIVLSEGELDALRAYESAGGRGPLYRVEGSLRRAGSADYPGIERQLLTLLADPRTTLDAKRFVCGSLGKMGSAACVAPLAGLLADGDLAEAAWFGLARIPAPAAASAMAAGLEQAKKPVRRHLLAALGTAGDERVLPVLRKYSSSADGELAAVAIRALGRLGTGAALAALREIRADEDRGGVVAAALLSCAERVARNGSREAAAEVYATLWRAGPGAAVRAAAAVGLARTRGENALSVIEELLDAEDRILWGAGMECVRALPPGTGTTSALTRLFPGLPTRSAVVLVNGLRERGDGAAAPAIRLLLDAADEGLRAAACQALSRLGSAEDVPLLVERMKRNAADGEAARLALARLDAPGVLPALVRSLDRATTPLGRLRWLEVIGASGDVVSGDLLLGLAREPDRKVRRKALELLADTGGRETIAGLVELLGAELPVADREKAEACLAALCRRHAGDGLSSRYCLTWLPKADPAARASLHAVLGRLGDEATLPVLKEAAENGQAPIREAAVRALASWPRASAYEPLLAVARRSEELTLNVLALRGCRRLLDILGRDLPDAELKNRYDACRAAARRGEERALFRFDPDGVQLRDLVVKSTRKYLVHRAGMKPGARWATDRAYTFTEIPGELLRGTYIEGAMNDKYTPADEEWMRFTVDVPVMVYIAYDKRCTKLPEWLVGWKKTGGVLKNNTGGSDLVVYGRRFPPGKVILNGNKAPGVGASYTVVIQAAE